MISDELKNRIKEALNIVDVIGEFISLRKKGVNYVGYCPFHQDSNPSLMVSPGKQIWKCFPCDMGGDIFSFVQEHEKLSFYEAVKWCADKAGIEIESKTLTPEEQKKIKERDALRVAINASTDFFQENIILAEMYLRKRGFEISNPLLREFKIGYAPEGKELHNNLKHYSNEYLQKIGVIGKHKFGGFYDVFQDRVMFPYISLSGNILGFTGRSIQPNPKSGKYINTADTELFNKGKCVFGLFQAKRSISNLNEAYLVEGQFDVLSMHAAGVTNTIAAGGTSLTEDHIKQILRFTPNITLIFDNDTAGQKAALTKCKILLQHGANVRCIRLPEKSDPDDLARELKDGTKIWLSNHTQDFVTYFEQSLNTHPDDPIRKEEAYETLINLIAEVKKETLRNSYIRTLSEKFAISDVSIIKIRVHEIIRKQPSETLETIKPGIYGLDELPKFLKEHASCELTSKFENYVSAYGNAPVIYIHGLPAKKDIQELRRTATLFVTSADDISISSGRESEYMNALAELYKNGITDITVVSQEKESEESEDDDYREREIEKEYNFLTYYIKLYHTFFTTEYLLEKAIYIERCANMISYASESIRIVNSKQFSGWLGLTQQQYNAILKPFLEKRKSRLAISSQRNTGDYEYDPDQLPDYVENSQIYSDMYRFYNFYPRINADGEPIGYVFIGDKNVQTLVGDFYMEPLLHIYDTEAENNKRILKINRRFYKTPLYIEVQSRALLKKSTIEEILINLEAVNFSNGEEKHWTKIKEWMSRHYITCMEIKTYGNQQREGLSRKEDENFFAFSNGIFHFVDGKPQFDPADEIGVVVHNDKNYYLPAYSKIYAGLNRDSDKYESIRTLLYNEIPLEKQCTFDHWAELMDKVYSINNNGKWAILYAIMCAFRSNIHCIDRLFTALFFMGPMMSGKTQIGISIRSLFISPKVPIFNLNTGTYAALSSLMSSVRDVPVVLDEYNNKDISDQAFQLLKGIVYDGDGRQKRKGTSGREIETEKVYAPVVISGQETPQRDDNALMSRVIICEVPKPIVERTEEQKTLFQTLKEIEDPDRVGLSNVLFEVLKLRPIVQEHYKTIQRSVVKDLTKALPTGGGDMVRIINTVSLFLAMCKLIEDYTSLKLPFTYDSFFQIALEKVKMQVELISHTDKIATFFKAMDVMINTGHVKEGRDYAIDAPGKLTLKLPGNERKEYVLPNPETKVLFLRVSNIYTIYQRSSYNAEQTTQSTIEQNLRSNPAYIGIVNARRFKWYETIEVPRGGIDMANDNPDEAPVDNTMVRNVEPMVQSTSCVALNYDIFKQYYDIDLERSNKGDSPNQELPF